MITAQDILNFIETIAPKDLKMDWDNVGLLCGRSDKPVKTVLIALDPFTHVCEEAAAIGAALLVTHHPLIFQPVSSVTPETTVGRAIMKLIGSDITAINAHTNLDCATGGVNDTLAEILGLQNIQTIAGDPDGLLRQGEITPIALNAFLQHIKQALSCPGIRFVDGGKPVHQVAVGGGSCGSELQTVIASGCDTFVTADVKYNQFCDAKELGINLIDAGHFATENPVISRLAAKIQTAFPEICVHISQNHSDCIKFF